MAGAPTRATLTVLNALGPEPASTSEVYDRVGYAQLVRCGLVPYAAFRRVLAQLAAEGLARHEEDEDGASIWQRTERGDALAGVPPTPGDDTG